MKIIQLPNRDHADSTCFTKPRLLFQVTFFYSLVVILSKFFHSPYKIKQHSKPIFILLFSSISVMANCQNNYLPIVNSGQLWMGWDMDLFSSEPPYSFRYTYSENSIMLGSNHYYQRNQSINKDGSEMLVEGYYRESEGKIYKYNEVDNNEITIVDMSLSLNDTITVSHVDPIPATLQVINVDSVRFEDNLWRKRITLNCLKDPMSFATTTWIEGIGELVSSDPYCALDYFDGELVCVYNDSGELIFTKEEGIDCWITTSTEKLGAASSKVYPNPVIDELYIEGYDGSVDYMIYSISGKLIISSRTESNRISVEQLQAGMYILNLKSANKKASIRLAKW